MLKHKNRMPNYKLKTFKKFSIYIILILNILINDIIN
jgi:hypothetical protein